MRRTACGPKRHPARYVVPMSNGAPTTADRSFAVSLNLNDDFEGGELIFPEYSGTKVSPPAGAAAVFSCSVLHEARPVTRGRRFVLTTLFRTKT